MTNNIDVQPSTFTRTDDDSSADDPAPNSLVTLLVQCEAWISLGDIEKTVNNAYNAVSACVPAVNGREVVVVLADDAELRSLNGRFRGKDKPTNVLSFPQIEDIAPYDSGMDLPLGDIIIAYETVLREADEENKLTLHHFTHMIVHGLLHLAGFDHETSVDAEQMEALEREILASMNIPDPYNSVANGLAEYPDRRCI